MKLNGSFENVIPSNLGMDKSIELCKELGAKVKLQYYENEDVTLAIVDKYIQVFKTN